MSEVTIHVDSRALHEAMRKAPVKVQQGVKKWIKETSFKAERNMKQNLRAKVSIGSSGRTLNSIGTTITGNRAEVKPTAKSAIYTERGRRPGKMPPFHVGSDLANWARRVGANPFLVARSIGRKGTKGIKFVEKTYKEIKPQAEHEAAQMLNEIVRSI